MTPRAAATEPVKKEAESPVFKDEIEEDVAVSEKSVIGQEGIVDETEPEIE